MVELKDQDMGDGMQCSYHPYTKNPGGICAFCLQEKLGKLVSSSFPLPKQVSSSSSSYSSPSFRSDSVGSSASVAGNLSASSLSLSLAVAKSGINNVGEGYYRNVNNGRATKLPFLLAKKKKKMLAASSANRTADIVYKRSKSTTAPMSATYAEDFSPRKRGGFWSFLHLYSSKHQTSSSSTSNSNSNSTSTSTSKKVESFRHPRAGTTNQNENGLFKTDKNEVRMNNRVETGSASSSSSSSMSKRVFGGVSNKNGIDVIVEEDGSPNIVVAEATPGGGGGGGGSSFERKVSRSRSVGCGSRSFSGDFFERISNGFGDCTLRRVESQREGGNKAKVSSNPSNGGGGGGGMREMVRCGGIFGGFMIMTSSSSSSSSSSSATTWVSSSSADHHHHQHHHHHHHHNLANGRNRSWGWAFASPMRAFSSTTNHKASSSSSSGKDGKRSRTITETSNKNTTPNLDAIPSLLAVRS